MSKKMLRIAAIYAVAVITVLGVYAYVSRRNLNDYRYAAKYSSQRSVEESVAAVRALSQSLGKSVYAVDGSMCGQICAESCAQARSAQTALATLPFSTQELERISGFLGTTGDYAYTLCSEAVEEGFTDEQVKTLSMLSETAAKLADSLAEMQGDLNDKLVTIDSSELRLENVGVEETERLSHRMLTYEANFPEQKELKYDGKYSAQEQCVTGNLSDTQKIATAADFAGVGLGELKMEYDYKGENGLRCFSAGELEICVSCRGVESMSQSRLVSEEKITEEEAVKTASRFLNGHGYDSVDLISAVKNGAVEHMEFARIEGDALCLDETLSIAVALDDNSVYSFNAERYDGEEIYVQWVITQEEASQKLPESVELAECRKVIIKSAGGKMLPCYELKCTDGERTVKIYISGETGKQQRIEM